MQDSSLYLALGCFGRRDDDFISCRAVENRILLLSESLSHYNDIMDYLDTLRLFDRPLFDPNAIRHCLYNMQDRYDQKFRRLWSEKQYRLFEKFMIDHKACGFYLKLILVNNEYDEQKSFEDERVLICANKK